MNKKILLIGLVFLLSLSFANADLIDYTSDNAVFYKFTGADDATSALLDLSANSLDLTNFGSTSWTSGSGFDFDGTNDYLSVADDVAVDLEAADYVVCAWVNFDTSSNTGNRFVQKGNSGNGGWTFGRNAIDKQDFFGGLATTIQKRDNAADTDTTTTQLYCYVGDRSSAATSILYRDAVAASTYANSAQDTNSFDSTSALTIGYGEANYFDGQIGAVYIWKGATVADDFTSSVISEIYGFGEEWNPYASEPATDEIFPQIIDATYDLNLTINSNSYQEIFTETFIPLNDTLSYNTWVLQLEAVNKDTVATCKAEINGTSYNTETNVSLLAGEYNIMYLYSDDYNLTANTTYEAKVSCKRDTTSGAKLSISDVEGQITLFTDLDGTVIQDLFADVTANLSSSSFVEIYSENFTTSNYTGDNLQITLIADGEATYTHDSTGFIELYLEVDGVAGAIAEKYGVAGSVNNGAELDMIKNVTANTNVTIKAFARSTTSDGAIHTKFNLMEVFTHPYETAFNNLSNTAITTGTWATIDTLYLNNSGHSTHDIAIKTEFNVESLSGAQQAYYRIKIGTEYSQERVIEINTVDHAMAIEHHLVSNPGNVNTSIELQAYTTNSNANITHGEIMAYLVNEINAIPQFYEVTARNVYDNATILTFNVTDDSGTTYNSNATGAVTIFNVNGLADFTTSATGYFNTTTLNHDTTTNITVDMIQSYITFNALEIITNNSLTGEITIGGVTKDTNETFNLKAGTYEVTFTNSSYFSKSQNFTITALQNETLNITDIGDSILKINATNAQTGAPELEFNLSFQYNGTEIATYQTTVGEINITLIQGFNYTIFINDSLHAQQYFYEVPDETYYNVTYILSEINSILITFYDEITGEVINGTNMTALIVGDVDYLITTTTGSFYQNLVVPEGYEIRYYSTLVDDYKLRSTYFTLSPLSFQEIDLYSLNTTINETNPEFTAATITFLILDNNFQPVEDARVVVQRYYTAENGFISVFQRLTNSEGEAVGIFETIDAFYRYNVYIGDTLAFSSSASGVQFTEDETITLYVDTTINYGQSFSNIFDLADVSTLDFISTGNFTGYFEMSYTNSNLLEICLNVTDIAGVVVDGECQTTSTGTIQLSVSAPTTKTSTYIARASAYDATSGQYIQFDQETKSFSLIDLLGNNEDINTAAIFVATIILTAIALMLIRFPVVALLAQGIVFIFMIISPIPFLLGTVSATISWVFSVIITAIFILIRGKNE